MPNQYTRELKKNYIPTSEFYSQVIDSLHEYAIITTNKDLLINSWSSGAAKIFGYEQEEVLGKDIRLIFTSEDNECDIVIIETKKALKEGRSDDNRWHIRKDKSRFFAFGLTFPLKSKEGKLLGFVKILRDLTETKKSEETIKKYVKELEALNTHKDNIMTVLSHDLRNPLSTIIMGADLLKMIYDKISKEEVLNMIDQIHKAAMNQLKMLDHLLNWARIKFASETFSPKNILLKNFLKTVLNTFSEVAEINGLKLLNDIPEKIAVYADEKMLFSILQNLLSNAIKYSPEGGTISISSASKKGNVIVTVKDNGIGIPKEKQEEIFSPQMDLLSSVRKENQSAGIGLLLTKGFVEKNGGKIWVESTEGVGTSFHFTLPAGKA